MDTTTSQNQMILAHLKTGKEISPRIALREYGSLRLAARVHDLKREGWPIHCERRKVNNSSKVVGYYSLDMNKENWPSQ